MQEFANQGTTMNTQFEGFEQQDLSRWPWTTLEDVPPAIDAYHQDLQAAHATGDWRREAVLLRIRRYAQNLPSEAERAVFCHQLDLDFSRQMGDRRGEAAALRYLASAHRSLGQLQQAIECYEQALAIARDLGDRRGEAAILDGLGNAHRSLGNSDTALAYHHEVLALHRDQRRAAPEGSSRWRAARWREALALFNLGQTCALGHDPARAIAFWGEARAIFESFGARRAVEVLDKQVEDLDA
jgi:tetratricopeptide (TPR) repeat protein